MVQRVLCLLCIMRTFTHTHPHTHTQESCEQQHICTTGAETDPGGLLNSQSSWNVNTRFNERLCLKTKVERNRGRLTISDIYMLTQANAPHAHTLLQIPLLESTQKYKLKSSPGSGGVRQHLLRSVRLGS